MSKSKRILVVVLSIILVMCMSIVLGACKKESQNEYTPPNSGPTEAKPQESSYEEDIKNSIISTWGEAITGDSPLFLQEITRLSSYEITNITEDDIYIINVVVSGIDLGSKLKELPYEDFPPADDEDTINDYLLNIIKSCEITKTTTVIYAKPLADGYEISFSDTFVDAMSGKIYSYCMDLVDGILEG